MMPGLLSTPHPVPGRRVPALAGTAVVVVALPVFVAAGWSLVGWGIAAGLWVVFQLVGLGLAQLALGVDNIRAASIVAFGRLLRGGGLMIILIVIAAKDAHVGLPAAIVYALAFTAELATSLLAYLGGGDG
ncbi:MAG: hypothetical protein ACREUG_09370 [Steroidobacteraceae bacterium]